MGYLYLFYLSINSGCRNAIHSVRKIVERLTKGNNTVNICSLDLSKAFDKVNHYGLYIKLMKRLIPVVLLEVCLLYTSPSPRDS